MTTFAGGGGQLLTSLTTDADGTTRIDGGPITTTGNQIYNDAVTLGADATLSGNNITFASTVDGAQALTVNTSGSGTTTFSAPVGGTTALASLTTNADGSTHLNGGVVSTSGDQTYHDAVALGADTTVNGNDLTFGQTVDGAFALTVNSNGAGVTTFTGPVGGGTALTSLTTNADGRTRINGGAVNTTGAQSYGDAVTLGADTTLGGGSVSFGSTLDSDSTVRDLTINSPGAIVFGGPVGGISHLKDLTSNGTTTISGGVITTDEDQTYTNAVTLTLDHNAERQ